MRAAALAALRLRGGARGAAELPRVLASERGFASDAGPLKRTPLFDYHVAHGGKMVPFAGWELPIQYKGSIMESTKQCRTESVLFDVSHMCGMSLKGKDVIPFIESLVVGDIGGLANGTGSLSVMTNERGGIIDDTVITKVTDEHLYIVVNAGCREKDLAHMGKHLSAFTAKGGKVNMHIHDERALLALQGPKAVAAVQGLTKLDLNKFVFGSFAVTELGGVPCFVTRTGYTGEDGFEISVPNERAVELTEKIMAAGCTHLAGLGARDSLRLEAGLCLYGNDLTEDITPVEAGLAWTVGKRRREKFDFLGGAVVKQQLAEGASKRRVGLIVPAGAPARQHSKLLDAAGAEIGEVTSGGFSPCLQKNIAMGYVTTAQSKAGTPVKVEVRGKVNDAVVTKMPFIPVHYFKG